MCDTREKCFPLPAIRVVGKTLFDLIENQLFPLLQNMPGRESKVWEHMWWGSPTNKRGEEPDKSACGGVNSIRYSSQKAGLLASFPHFIFENNIHPA